MNLPQVIFIDWYKTLSNSLFWSQMDNEKQELINKAFFIKHKDLIKSWMRGEYSSEQICDIIEKETNIPSLILFQELENSCRNMKFVSDKIPDLIKNIRNKGTKVVIATDNMDTFTRFTIPGMNLKDLFDDFLVSCDLKILKSDVIKNPIPFFNNYLNKNNLKYSDAILLDDWIDKSGVYEKLGLKIVEIDSENKLVEVLQKYSF